MKTLYKKIGIFTIAITAVVQSMAQDATVFKTSGIADKKVETNFINTALMETYYKPAPKPIQFIGNRKARVIPDMDLDPNMLIKHDPFTSTAARNKTNSMLPSIAPVRNFNGLNDNSTFIPPDVNGTVGPNHTMIT